MSSNETCLVRQKFKEIHGEDAPIPAFIEAQCRPSESRRKRAVADNGTLVITFTFSKEIPFDCDDSCLDTISWRLRFQYFEAQWRIATGLALTFTDLETFEKLNITVEGELQLIDENPQVKCTLGRILSQDQEVCSKSVIYYISKDTYQLIYIYYNSGFVSLQSRVVLVVSSITLGLSQGVTLVPLATTRTKMNRLTTKHVLMGPSLL